uniref:Uncharacterized protein n=1 Tax=Junco hyemalis TaxID=40217 RepID=A0A8C5J6F0_JUNHY
MCPTSGTSMPMGLCSSTPSRHQPSTASSTTTTTSAPRRTRLAKSGAPTSVLKQFSGSRTPFGWRTKGRCVETWLFSSASSPPQCRNTLALCPGRKTPFLSSQGEDVSYRIWLRNLQLLINLKFQRRVLRRAEASLQP